MSQFDFDAEVRLAKANGFWRLVEPWSVEVERLQGLLREAQTGHRRAIEALLNNGMYCDQAGNWHRSATDDRPPECAHDWFGLFDERGGISHYECSKCARTTDKSAAITDPNATKRGIAD